MKDILIKGIEKSYKDNLVLDNINFLFPKGKKTAIVGESGIGKTSLMRILIGLEKRDKGTIDGLEGVKKGVVFQEDRLIENINAIKNIKLANRSLEDNFIKEELSKINIRDFDKKVSFFSGGMKRRIAIMRALLSEWDILFMDEPFIKIDMDNKRLLIEYIKEITKSRTLIFISHSMDDIKLMESDRILNLDKKKK